MSQKDLDRIADKVLSYRPPEAEPTEPPPPLKIIAGAADRPLVIGDIEIPCYVLEDETRVLTQAGFLEALGRHRKANVRGEERVPPVLQGKAIKPFISQEMLGKSRPIRFSPESGGVASGYRAQLLPEVCEVYLRARDAGVLPNNQQHVAKQAEILIRGLATVGVIALVDEATGYQRIREERALATILEDFIVKERQPWTRTFPYEFYEEICRLKGWPSFRAVKRPSVIGRYTNDLVYDRLAPGVLAELQRINPVLPETGARASKHHQWLTPELGHPKLREHLIGVIALMRAASSWDMAKRNIRKVYPKPGETRPMELTESDD